MNEKIIKGIVERYSNIEVGTKNDEKNTPFAYVDVYLLDHKYPNRFFFTSPEEAKEKLLDKVPRGSTVEFKIFKKDKFWNVDKKSFKLVYEGDGTVPKSQKDDNNNIIVRQNALRHADEWISLTSKWLEGEDITLEGLEKEYFRFAKECEKWILGDRD